MVQTIPLQNLRFSEVEYVTLLKAYICQAQAMLQHASATKKGPNWDSQCQICESVPKGWDLILQNRPTQR